jgi:ubiquinone/menaquinone biosynthesis C-methylase UbiE
MTVSEFKLRIYTSLSTLIASVMGKDRAKAFFEWKYWQWQHLTEGGELSNNHYLWSFTEGFGLSRDFYKGLDVLDVGCGPRGSLEWCTEAKSIVGLDPLARKYTQLNSGTPHRMKYVEGGAEEMPFNNHSFDVVSFMNSLDHVADLSRTLSEVHRVVRPGGHVLILTDIHDEPAVCEPTVISWDLKAEFADEYDIVLERRLRRFDKIYDSLRRLEEYNEEKAEHYGLLQLHLKKRA